MAVSTDLTFSLGSVTFGANSPFELPTGGLIIEWLQKLIVTEFAGGYKSAQAVGEFVDPVTWTGWLFGGTAMDRHWELKKLQSNVQVVTLTYGTVSIDGAVKSYKANFHSQFEIEYTITFEPLRDESSPSSGGGGAQANQGAILANAQTNMMQQAQAPASGYAFSPPIQNNVGNLNTLLNQAMTAAGGSVGGVTPANSAFLQGQISNIQAQLQPLISGADPIASSAASDLNGSLAMINQSLSQTAQSILKIINVQNPDLYALAAQYYLDPNKWDLIADANPAINNDPLPIGQFLLIIPRDPSNGTT